MTDLLEGSQVLREANEHAETNAFVRTTPVPIEELTFAIFGDASRKLCPGATVESTTRSDN